MGGVVLSPQAFNFRGSPVLAISGAASPICALSSARQVFECGL